MGKRLYTFLMDSLDGRVQESEGEDEAVIEGEVGEVGGGRRGRE